MPGDSGFFRNDAARPNPPFTRTKLSNSLKGGAPPPILRINGIPVPPQHRRKYRLFKPEQIVGEYQFTWHHNIPWNILRKTWDTVVTFCSPKAVSGLFNFYAAQHPNEGKAPRLLQKMLHLRSEEGIGADRSAASSRTCAAWIDHLETRQKATPHPRIYLEGEDRDDLRTILCWGAWNLNEGPGTRVDDPDELFDSFGPFDANESRRARYIAVERLNLTLNQINDDYIKQANQPCSPGKTCDPWSEALLESLRICDALTAAQRSIVYFDPMMWAPVTMSASASDLFDIKANATVENGMLTADLRGALVYKQMKKLVRMG